MDSTRARCEHWHEAELLEVDTAFVRMKSSEQRERPAPPAGKFDQQVLEVASAVAAIVGVVPDFLAQPHVAVHRHRVEEDVDVEQVGRPLSLHPAVDCRAPV